MPRRRAIAAVPIALAGLSVGLLGGCSTASPTSAPTTTTTSAAASSSETATSTEGATPTTVASATATEAATTPTVTTTAPAPAPTASAAPAPPLVGPLPTDFTPLGKVIKEDALGHEVAVLRMARVLPWPTGSTGQSAAFELVAVEMRWTPGTKYTASLRELDFALITGSQYPNRPDRLIDQQLAAAGWALLPTEVAAGQTATGWLVFKIDPKAATSIRLDYTRPEIAVTGTRTRFPKKVFSLQIVG
jgi:hypothetical protein